MPQNDKAQTKVLCNTCDSLVIFLEGETVKTCQRCKEQLERLPQGKDWKLKNCILF